MSTDPKVIIQQFYSLLSAEDRLEHILEVLLSGLIGGNWTTHLEFVERLSVTLEIVAFMATHSEVIEKMVQWYKDIVSAGISLDHLRTN